MSKILTIFIFVITVLIGSSDAISATNNHVDTDMIPALTRTIRKGEIIQESDLLWIEVPSHRITGKTILDPSFLVGKTPRRTIKAKKPIKEHSLRKPLMVKKGSLMTILFKMPNMVVTARAKSLQDGGNRDVIRVQNIQSNRIVSVTITGEGEGEVANTSNQIVSAQ